MVPALAPSDGDKSAMKRYLPCCLAALVVLASLSRPAQAQDAEPSAAPQAQTEAGPAGPSEVARPILSFGIGYPDVRLRGRLWGPLDSELKFAFDNSSQAYSLRLYLTCWSWSALSLSAGLEAGAIRFGGIDNLSGDGAFWEPFAGLAYQASRLIGLTAEIGPAFTRLSADGVSIASTNTVITTAIYFRIF
jgi:hypothetical protein